MSFPGSVDNGEVDTEYSPDHRQSAQELWFRACDKRVSALELQVHRLLNAEHPPEADYAHIPAAEWQDICAELETLRAFKARVPDDKPEMDDADLAAAYMLGRYASAEIPTRMNRQHYRRGWLAGTKANQEMQQHLDETAWDELTAERDALKEELEQLRATRPDMDEHGVHLSHDAYDMLEREAAIGRSVPWNDIRFCTTVTDRVAWINSEFDPNDEINSVRNWLNENTPKEAAE
jgi:hypothetical protein